MGHRWVIDGHRRTSGGSHFDFSRWNQTDVHRM